MANLEIIQFICRADNYGVLLHDQESGQTAAIDAPDSAEIIRHLATRGWQLTHLFTTHHHIDHVEGNIALKDRFGCTIIGPRAEAERIPGIDEGVSGGQSFAWAGREVRVFECPGHTKGHVAFFMPSDQVVFAGDTLFSLGCGRVFEGTLSEMHLSVAQFKALPPETRLYCGHEYTQSNARFALSLEPGNEMLRARASEVESLRAAGSMTCPTTIGAELSTNPFLRTQSPEIRQALGMETASDGEVFAELRRRKDSFK